MFSKLLRIRIRPIEISNICVKCIFRNIYKNTMKINQSLWSRFYLASFRWLFNTAAEQINLKIVCILNVFFFSLSISITNPMDIGWMSFAFIYYVCIFHFIFIYLFFHFSFPHFYFCSWRIWIKFSTNRIFKNMQVNKFYWTQVHSPFSFGRSVSLALPNGNWKNAEIKFRFVWNKLMVRIECVLNADAQHNVQMLNLHKTRYMKLMQNALEVIKINEVRNAR